MTRRAIFAARCYDAGMRTWPAALALICMLALGVPAHAEKAGGTLRVYNPDSPPGLNIYEQATPFGQGR